MLERMAQSTKLLSCILWPTSLLKIFLQIIKDQLQVSESVILHLVTYVTHALCAVLQCIDTGSGLSGLVIHCSVLMDEDAMNIMVGQSAAKCSITQTIALINCKTTFCFTYVALQCIVLHCSVGWASTGQHRHRQWWSICWSTTLHICGLH